MCFPLQPHLFWAQCFLFLRCPNVSSLCSLMGYLLLASFLALTSNYYFFITARRIHWKPHSVTITSSNVQIKTLLNWHWHVSVLKYISHFVFEVLTFTFVLKAVLHLFVIYDKPQQDLNFLFFWCEAPQFESQPQLKLTGVSVTLSGQMSCLTWCSCQGHGHSPCYTWTAPSAASPSWASAPGRYPEPPQPSSKHQQPAGGALFYPCFYSQPLTLFTGSVHCKPQHLFGFISLNVRPAPRFDDCQEHGPIGLKCVGSWPMRVYLSVLSQHGSIFFFVLKKKVR